MAKLSKEQAKLHRQADALTRLDRELTEDERAFVLEHWQESADTASVLDGAFFTPMSLAAEVAHHVHGNRVIDLCAGIGRLAYAARRYWGSAMTLVERELTCVEKNPEYVRVGRKVLPDARWIEADVTEVLSLGLGQFDAVVSNPPFGRVRGAGKGPRYRGPHFEYHVIDIAAHLAPVGAHIVPQHSAPFRYSGVLRHSHETTPEFERFARETGMNMWFNYGLDTSEFRSEWRGVSPAVELVLHNVHEDRLEREAAEAEAAELAARSADVSAEADAAAVPDAVAMIAGALAA